MAYMLFVVYLMVDAVRSVMRVKRLYFHRFWSYVDMGIVACSWISVGLYAWRSSESNRIGDVFARTRGYAFIDLRSCVIVNDVLNVFLSVCCFLGWIKCVRLCRFNRRITLFIQTLRQAARELLSFATMFVIVFVAFVCLFYLLFVGKLGACSSFSRTSGMLFEMMLMKFDAYELIGAAAVLGPLCFALFILVVVFVCLSMFVSIIADQFRSARERLKLDTTDDERMVTFMLDKMRRWMGES